MEIGEAIENHLKKRSARIKRNIVKIFTIVFIVLSLLSIFIMNIEGKDSVTTLTGKYISWTTNPYSTIGYYLLIISGISLAILIVYGAKLWIEKTSD